tara:strand:- start:71 stop:289 length:219 start_codon:yes stop_codon:yes gene_type:complete
MKSLKYIGEIGGIVGALMVATNTPLSAYGYIFFTASSVAWTIVAWRMKEWSLMRMSIAFTTINFIGIYNWFV